MEVVHSNIPARTSRAFNWKFSRINIYGSRYRIWNRPLVYDIPLHNYRLRRQFTIICTQSSFVWSRSINSSFWAGRVLRSVYFYSLAIHGNTRLVPTGLFDRIHFCSYFTESKLRSKCRF